jgi:hypothetical protein
MYSAHPMAGDDAMRIDAVEFVPFPIQEAGIQTLPGPRDIGPPLAAHHLLQSLHKLPSDGGQPWLS